MSQPAGSPRGPGSPVYPGSLGDLIARLAGADLDDPVGLAEALGTIRERSATLDPGLLLVSAGGGVRIQIPTRGGRVASLIVEPPDAERWSTEEIQALLGSGDRVPGARGDILAWEPAALGFAVTALADLAPNGDVERLVLRPED